MVMFFSSCAAAGQLAHRQSFSHMHLSGCIKSVLALWLLVSAGVVARDRSKIEFSETRKWKRRDWDLCLHRQPERLMKAGFFVPAFVCVLFDADFLCYPAWQAELASNAGA